MPPNAKSVYSGYAGQINYSRKWRTLQNLGEIADWTCRQSGKKTSKNFASRKVLKRFMLTSASDTTCQESVCIRQENPANSSLEPWAQGLGLRCRQADPPIIVEGRGWPPQRPVEAHSVGRQGLAAWFVVAAGGAGRPSGFIVALTPDFGD